MCAVICVGQLIEKAEAREKERLKEESKRQKRLENSFKNMLKQSAPPLDVGNQWDEVSRRACRSADRPQRHTTQKRLYMYTLSLCAMCIPIFFTSNALDCACIRAV